MNLADALLDTPALQSFVKRVPAKTRLFRQGDLGHSLIVVADGIIEILDEKGGNESQITIVQPGEMAGEQSFLQSGPYRRAFTARTMTEALYLEIGPYEIALLQKKSPAVMAKVMTSILQIAGRRLKVANDLARALASSNNTERLLKLIVHFGQVSGHKTERGTQVLLTPERFTYYIDMDREQVKACLGRLEKSGLIRNVGNDYYTIGDTTRLLAVAA